MSDESKPEDNEPTRRYPLWRDLSANARFPSEDFVARAALHARAERNPAEGLNQFRSEYPLQETAEQVSVPVALPPLPPDRTSAVNAKMAAAVTALFVVGFAAAVGIKQLQNPPATLTAEAPSSESRPVDAPPTAPVESLASAAPADVTPGSSATGPNTPSESADVVSAPPAATTKAAVEQAAPIDTRAVSARADASTTSQPERPAAPLTTNARSTVASTPASAPAPVTAPDPAPIAVNRETAVNANATGAVDVAVPAAVRNTPVATTGGDVPSSAGATSATEADLRPVPLDRPVPALSTAAAPAPIAAPATVTPTTAIQRTLQGYQSAFSRLDVNAVRQVWPSVDQKALAKAFDQLKSEDLTLENCKVTVTGVNAVAACGGKTEYVPKIGSKSPRVERHQWRISLQQVAERWVVHQVDVTAP